MKSEAVSGNTALDLRGLGHPLCHLRSQTYLALMIPDAFMAGDFSTTAASAATLLHQRSSDTASRSPVSVRKGVGGGAAGPGGGVSWAQALCCGGVQVYLGPLGGPCIHQEHELGLWENGAPREPSGG